MAHSPETLERIRAATDIVALIGRQVPLRRSGRNHMGRCPFHQERTPSFSVNAEKAMFYCFGCHRGGDAFAFVMQAQGLDFGAAVRYLAAAAGVVLADQTPQQLAQQARHSELRRVLDSLQKHLVPALWHRNNGHARQYLASRGVPAAAARHWGLGYAGDPVAMAEALDAAGHSQALQAEAGVLTDASEHAAPKLLFAHRLTFPIHDLQGGLVGFGGRRLREGALGPKYLNSRDSDLFHKRAQLFGLHRAHNHIRHTRQVVLVEGFMDVLAAHASDMSHTVAALGTALTRDHAAALARLADEVVVMLDGDAAGERAAGQSALLLLGAGLRVKLAWLPPGEDPASLAQRGGPQALQEVLAAALPAVEALMARAFAPGAVTDIESRVLAAQELMPLLDAMGQSLSQELYVERLAAHVGVDVAQLRQHWKSAKPKGTKSGPSQPEARGARDGREAPSLPSPSARSEGPGPPRRRQPPTPSGSPAQAEPADGSRAPAEGPGMAPRPAELRELEMVRELLLFPELRPKLMDLQEYLLSPRVQALVEQLSTAASPDAQEAVFLAHVPDPVWRQRLGRIVPLPEQALDGTPSQANRTFADILRRLKWRHVDAALRHVLRDLALADSRGEATDALLRRKRELTATKRALAKADK